MFPATAAESTRRMSKCNCRVCRRSRKLESILSKYNMAQKDLEFMQDILLSLLTAELDRDWELAELDDRPEKTKQEKGKQNESTEK